MTTTKKVWCEEDRKPTSGLERNVKTKESKGAGAEVQLLLIFHNLYSYARWRDGGNSIACITEDAEPHAAVWGPVGIRQITPSARIAFSTALPELDEPRWSCHARPTLG